MRIFAIAFVTFVIFAMSALAQEVRQGKQLEQKEPYLAQPVDWMVEKNQEQEAHKLGWYEDADRFTEVIIIFLVICPPVGVLLALI